MSVFEPCGWRFSYLAGRTRSTPGHGRAAWSQSFCCLYKLAQFCGWKKQTWNQSPTSIWFLFPLPAPLGWVSPGCPSPRCSLCLRKVPFDAAVSIEQESPGRALLWWRGGVHGFGGLRWPHCSCLSCLSLLPAACPCQGAEGAHGTEPAWGGEWSWGPRSGPDKGWRDAGAVPDVLSPQPWSRCSPHWDQSHPCWSSGVAPLDPVTAFCKPKLSTR